jgi:hypothetical protein
MLQNTFANISKPFANKKNTLPLKKNVFAKQNGHKKALCLASLKSLPQKNPKVNTKTIFDFLQLL